MEGEEDEDWLAELGGVWLVELEGEDEDEDKDGGVEASGLLGSGLEVTSSGVFVPSVDAAADSGVSMLGVDEVGDAAPRSDRVSGGGVRGMVASASDGGGIS